MGSQSLVFFSFPGVCRVGYFFSHCRPDKDEDYKMSSLAVQRIRFHQALGSELWFKRPSSANCNLNLFPIIKKKTQLMIGKWNAPGIISLPFGFPLPGFSLNQMVIGTAARYKRMVSRAFTRAPSKGKELMAPSL